MIMIFFLSPAFNHFSSSLRRTLVLQNKHQQNKQSFFSAKGKESVALYIAMNDRMFFKNLLFKISREIKIQKKETAK